MVSMNESKLPKHVAIIPDGNRRWAKLRNQHPLFGHQAGYARIQECLVYAKEKSISVMTIWAFSTENWNRKEDEVEGLMKLIYKGLSNLYNDAKKEKIKIVHIGRRDRLDTKINQLIEEIEEETKKYSNFTLCIALDYGGEDEIMRAEKRKEESGSKNKTVADFLDTTLLGISDPDLIVRTGGESRTSGFMPLQSAYSEWVFEEKLFPDFDIQVFQDALDVYASRTRRFGR